MVGGGGVGGGGGLLENANPLIYQRSGERPVTAGEEDEQVPDSIDAREIFDLIRSINDPEHPLTLEELNVVEQVRVQVSDPESTVAVAFTPTIPHCSMATLIGLSIKVKLLRSLPQRFKMDVHITPGTHASEHAGKGGLVVRTTVLERVEQKQEREHKFT
ncbi:PREDICTED: mitotic spindle-associated MMXD complex subunit MIP18 [Colobus angolensis palliatus]|uniref:mitotic spindle-associated MMXD complex subunit MIP18 n=1 Tax=Colobus angolensis palliatus TaxID=336983 RepID=UPI0005F3D3B8|nr:PREDICTED: mitotic spindle-associated MMXD complex subunit MIP18 [Colobus angolensis palliatus]